MKKLLISFVVAAFVLLMGSCGNSRQVAYFQNIDTLDLTPSRGLFDAKIMPKDQLTITVNTTDPTASAPFNLGVTTLVGAGGMLNGGGALQSFLVDNDGFINYPVLGKVHVQGLTTSEVQDLIKAKIQPYLAKSENPIVTVRMASFHVTMIGSLGSSILSVSNERMTIVEAIASSGDLDIMGRRDNILLIREDATGMKHSVRLNMTDANLINSPYYYLQQNDVIYVEPNDIQKKNAAIGSSTTIWFSFIGITTSIASLLVNILRN